MAERFNIAIDQGSTYRQTFSIVHQTTGNPYDLSAFTIASHIRVNFTDASPSAVFTASIDDPATDGNFTLQLPATTTALLSGSCYYYDVELTQGTEVVRIVEGKAVVSPEITK